jgi:hypothetical protein
MSHRHCVVAVLASLFGVLAPSAIAASPEGVAETFPASVSATGAWANGEGTGEYTPVSISDDGRYVAFLSAADNLGEAGPAAVEEGFVKDLDTGAVALVSRADGEGGEAAAEPGISGFRISGDGRYVVFTSAATNLGTPLPGEAAGERHVYRRDLETGATTLVDRVSGGEGAILSRGAEAASISADGRYIAFTARVENLEDPAGDHAETANAVGYVRDLQTATTIAISRADGATGEVGDEPAEGLSLSADGRYVVFSSRATNLVPGVEEGVWEQVYLRDLQTSATTLISQNALGEPGDRGSSLPVISGAGGCRVQFSSIAFNLLEPSPLEVSGEQVYVVDRCLSPPTVTLISQRTGEPLAPFAYSVSGVSDDGRKAIFIGEFAGSPCCHLYLRDLAAGSTAQLDRASGAVGAPADAEVQETAISANGCRAVFASRAGNLFGAGPGGEEPTEVYVRQLAPCADPPEPAGAGAASPPKSIAASPVVRGPTAFRVAALGRRQLLLSLSGPGRVAVRVRRFQAEPRPHWQFLRTLVAEAAAAGQVAVQLPDLAPGRYRLNVHLHRSRSPGIVRMLAIPAI